MPQFVPILVAAILIFAALVVVSGVVYPVQGYNTGVGTYVSDTYTVQLSSGFTLNSLSDAVELSEFSGVVNQGLLSGTDEEGIFLVDDLEEVRGGRIDFQIKDTNSYGPFYIFLNDNAVHYDALRIGNYSIKLDRDELENENEIRFSAGSSGWRFWAPAVYDFESKVYADYTGSKYYNFVFDVSRSDLENLLRLRGYALGERKSGDGKYVIRVNGEEVKKADSESFFIVRNSLLHVGSNTVQVRIDGDARYEFSDLSLTFYWD